MYLNMIKDVHELNVLNLQFTMINFAFIKVFF